jgi:hypothetical protein
MLYLLLKPGDFVVQLGIFANLVVVEFAALPSGPVTHSTYL